MTIDLSNGAPAALDDLFIQTRVRDRSNIMPEGNEIVKRVDVSRLDDTAMVTFQTYKGRTDSPSHVRIVTLELNTDSDQYEFIDSFTMDAPPAPKPAPKKSAGVHYGPVNLPAKPLGCIPEVIDPSSQSGVWMILSMGDNRIMASCESRADCFHLARGIGAESCRVLFRSGHAWGYGPHAVAG